MDGQAAPLLGGQTAMIAENNEFFRVASSSVLSRRLGFQNETATFDAAVELLTPSDDIDLALFDLNMPDATGVSAPSSVSEEMLCVLNASWRDVRDAPGAEKVVAQPMPIEALATCVAATQGKVAGWTSAIRHRLVPLFRWIGRTVSGKELQG